MLIKLFATRMVASRRSGISISFNRRVLFAERDLRKDSISLGFREKKATSAPDTRAEDIKSKKTTRNAARISMETGFKNISAVIRIPEGYGSVTVSNMNQKEQKT
jgi:hypothetical protein